MPQLHVSDCLGSYSAVAANISGAVYAVEPQYVSLVKWFCKLNDLRIKLSFKAS